MGILLLLGLISFGGFLIYVGARFLFVMALLIPRLIYIWACQTAGSEPKPWWPFNKPGAAANRLVDGSVISDSGVTERD